MKTGIIILCRYNSSRLPGKILKQINGKPILQYILDRVSQVPSFDQVVVATSSEASDDPIIAFCQDHGIAHFRGSLNNVSERFLACALTFGMDYAIRINGDNLFVDSHMIGEMIKIASLGKYDFITNVKGRTFPVGMSVEIVDVSFYQKIISQFDQAKYQEHVTLYFYEHESAVKRPYFYENTAVPEPKGLKLALDTQADFERAEKMIMKMDKEHTCYQLQELTELVKEI